MGKQKLDQLLKQLEDNHAQDIENAAAIFTVAQGAVNQLAADSPQIVSALGESSAAPSSVTKADLLKRYGSYNACRQAAKRAGITFSHTPRWAQLVTAFSYLPACQACVSTYLQQHPDPNLKGVSIKLTLSP
ncbi:MAG: hypothetical protein ACR2FS_08495 [Phormidesmis sp.]